MAPAHEANAKLAHWLLGVKPLMSDTLDMTAFRRAMEELVKPVEYKPMLYFAPDGKIYDAGRNYALVLPAAYAGVEADTGTGSQAFRRPLAMVSKLPRAFAGVSFAVQDATEKFVIFGLGDQRHNLIDDVADLLVIEFGSLVHLHSPSSGTIAIIATV